MCPEKIMKSQNANELMTKKGINKKEERKKEIEGMPTLAYAILMFFCHFCLGFFFF